MKLSLYTHNIPMHSRPQHRPTDYPTTSQ